MPSRRSTTVRRRASHCKTPRRSRREMHRRRDLAAWLASGDRRVRIRGMVARQSAASSHHTLHNRLHLLLHTRLHKRATTQVLPCHRPAIGPDPAFPARSPDFAESARFVTKSRRCHRVTSAADKAGDQDRTGDIQLGKLTFYR